MQERRAAYILTATIVGLPLVGRPPFCGGDLPVAVFRDLEVAAP
jgi:hypothetical protein